MTNVTVLPQIVDGFVMNPYFDRPHKPFNYYQLALDRLDAIRRAQGIYRARQYVSPLNISTTISGYDTFKDQVRIVPGSYVWGMNFCVITEGGLITDFTISLADHDSGIPFVSDPASGYIGTFAGQQFLTEPRLMLGSATLDVTLFNRTASDRQCQLVIYCAEPCVIVSEGN